MGYDAVDNDYFTRETTRVRQNPDLVRSLPGLTSPDRFFLASARLLPRKNMTGLVQAYGRYRQRSVAEGGEPPWRLVILGDGPDQPALEEIIHRDGIVGVTLAGFRQIDELPAYYGLASAFIHPAWQEPWGLVVNEAMASALPVLVSERCGCAPDLVAPGENGYVFDPSDIDHLAELMYRLSSGQTDLSVMGQASLARISQWGPDRFARGMYQALQTALNGARA